MNCLTEAIGMALPGNGTIPARLSARLRLAKHAGMQIMELIKRDITPPRHPDAGRLPQRRDGGHGPGLLDQHHAAPARHCP